MMQNVRNQNCTVNGTKLQMGRMISIMWQTNHQSNDKDLFRGYINHRNRYVQTAKCDIDRYFLYYMYVGKGNLMVFILVIDKLYSCWSITLIIPPLSPSQPSLFNPITIVTTITPIVPPSPTSLLLPLLPPSLSLHHHCCPHPHSYILPLLLP